MNLIRRGNPDFATLAGVIVAIGSVVGGLTLEGGSIRDIAQISAALMVLGGTLGAVLISTPLTTFVSAIRSLNLVFFERATGPAQIFEDLLRLSNKSRKTGLASLESDALAIEDPFFRKALNLAVDNTSVPEIRAMMEAELDAEEWQLEAESKVFETAGGYAPTVGIIGAVLGLIQVMKHLESIDEVGRGIAVSFVATVYGVALANLVFLPCATKLRARCATLIHAREMTLEGVIGISELLNPTLLRLRLQPYVSATSADPEQRAEGPAPSPRAARPRAASSVA